ncbi:MAG: AAA family ATPase, partial [Lachnospiraceae bacterium]|nr:AAA family ATPase [Lachnospiraceae bacterium]
MDLFDYMRENSMEKESPLAARMRPATLDEVVGQKHILGKGTLLYRAIKADKLSSIILYGPPGSGKTTITRRLMQRFGKDVCMISYDNYYKA